MITLKSPYARTFQAAPGFVSILTVLSMGLGLLIIMMYQETIQTQENQKNDLLRNDYQQREKAFLSALTNIVPNKAMRCMMDGSATETDLDWNTIFTEALTQSNAHQAITPTEATALGLSSHRSANTADTTLTPDSIIKSVFQHGGLISSGTNSVDSSLFDYPPLLSCDTLLESDDQTYPTISRGKSDGTNLLYGEIPAPKLHFAYQDQDEFIAKHNWWTFTASFADQNSAITRLTRASKQYLVSLYEIPAQLAINSVSFTNFGQHEGDGIVAGEDWSNITTTGGVFAGRVKAKGSFTSTGGIASRRGIELSDASNPLDSDNTARNQELYEGSVTSLYSSSSDGGHVTFIPIIPVLGAGITSGSDHDLYSEYLTNLKNWTTAGSDPYTRPINKLFYTRTLPVKFEETGTNTASSGSTAWKYYSRGANQCEIILIDDGLTDSFSYIANGSITDLGSKDSIQVSLEFVFPDIDSNLTVNLDRLISYLDSQNIDMSAVNSLCINSDKPVVLQNAKDLLADRAGHEGFINGLSIVTNQMLILDEDTNVGYDTSNYTAPALSLYAPIARYGKSSNGTLKIEITGALGSLAEKGEDDAVNIADLKVLGEDTRAANIKATLTSITNLNDLPPINMMNWMIVVREIRE